MNSTIREAIETIALAALVFLVLQSAVQNYRVQGASMVPGLVNNELVLVNKAVYTSIDAERVARYLPWLNPESGERWFPFHSPRQGEIVVFHNPEDPNGPDFVKRVIGEPGDTVEIVQGEVIVNGEALDEPYLERASTETFGPLVVPEGHYYVLGDNRLNSEDSRFFGTVPFEKIVGKVWLGYWPIDQLSLLRVHWGGW